MKRITISLSDEIAQALDRKAERRHASASEITRTALAVVDAGPLSWSSPLRPAS